MIFEVIPGQEFPRHNMWLYGVAWNSPVRNAVFVMPIPLNLIMKVARGAWGRMCYPARWMNFGDESAAYAAGRRAGMRDRITDEDIAAYLLRQKINEANSLQEANGNSASLAGHLHREHQFMAYYKAQMHKTLFDTSTIPPGTSIFLKSASEINRMALKKSL